MRQPTIFIFKDEKLQLVINNDIKDGLPLTACRMKEVINGEDSLTFAVSADHPDSPIVQKGCWAVIKDIDGFFRAYTIVEEKGDHDASNSSRQFYCENIAVNELNDDVVTDVRPQSTTALDALERLLNNANSLWEPGIVDNFGISSTNFYYERVMSGLQKIIEAWGGEVRFRVSMNARNEITGRYIDILSRRGQRTGKRFEFGKDLIRIEPYIDMKNLKTALYGRGRGEETDSGEYGRRITFADVEWSVAAGDPVDKPAGQEWVGDPVALEKYGHWNRDGSRRHRFDVFIWEGGPNEIADEEQYKKDLLKATWDYLQTINEPDVSYNMTALDLERATNGELKHEAVRLGDSVYVIDKYYAYDIRLEARISEIDRDMLDPSQTDLTIGNVISDLSSLIKQLKTEIDKKVSLGDPVSWLQGWRDVTNLAFEKSGAYVYISDNGDGIITTNRPITNIDNPPDLWVQIKSGGIRIADKLKIDGTPDWTTFMTGAGMIADTIMSGTLRTDLVTIGDANQNVKIDRDGVFVKNGLIRIEREDGFPIILGGRINLDLEIQPAEPPLTSPAVSLFSNAYGVWWETSASGNPQNCQFYTYEHKARYLVVRAFLFVESGATAYFSLETGTYAAGNVRVLASTTSTNTDPADEEARAVELKVDLGTPTGNRRSFYARLKSSDPSKKVYARITRKWLEG